MFCTFSIILYLVLKDKCMVKLHKINKHWLLQDYCHLLIQSLYGNSRSYQYYLYMLHAGLCLLYLKKKNKNSAINLKTKIWDLETSRFVQYSAQNFWWLWKVCKNLLLAQKLGSEARNVTRHKLFNTFKIKCTTDFQNNHSF